MFVSRKIFIIYVYLLDDTYLLNDPCLPENTYYKYKVIETDCKSHLEEKVGRSENFYELVFAQSPIAACQLDHPGAIRTDLFQKV